MRQLVYQYLWLIGSVLNHWKIPKYYDQGCRSIWFFIFIFEILKKVQFKILPALGKQFYHIKETCKKLSQKISAVSRVSSHFDSSREKGLIFKSIIKSQFSYNLVTFILMFHSRTPNSMINKIPQRTLRVYLGKILTKI